ncbi:MAG: ankyrin repeat domain-containing protein [Spirochaetaceae bacterium]|nr:ankyrin repeat domain-containing protein [Spirochaetaceae bacterium]
MSNFPARSYYPLFIRQGLPVNIQDRQGETLLMKALNFGDEDFAKVLLEAGADPNIRDASGRSALMNARSAPMIRLLLDRGADAAALDMNGRGLIHYAYPHTKDTLQALFAAGAGLDRPDNEGYTPLMRTAMKTRWYYGVTQPQEYIEALLELGADPLKKGPQGETLLLLYLNAERYDAPSVSLVQLFLNEGIDPAEADDSGNSPLSLILKRDDRLKSTLEIRRILTAAVDKKTLSDVKARLRRERREEFAGEIPDKLSVSALLLSLPAYAGLSVWAREGLYRDNREANWMAPVNAAFTGFVSGAALSYFLFGFSPWTQKTFNPFQRVVLSFIICPLAGAITGGVFAGVPQIREAFAHNRILYYLPSAAAGAWFTVSIIMIWI